jgi:hypothetical protein
LYPIVFLYLADLPSTGFNDGGVKAHLLGILTALNSQLDKSNESSDTAADLTLC